MPAKKKSDPMVLTESELNELKEILEEQRRELVSQARQALAATHDHDDPLSQTGDEVDQSTLEYEQAFEYRLRDREKFLLKKIHKALKRIEDEEYNACEVCDGPIGVARLRARPVATLCIECKEDQERDEKKYQKRRAYKIDYDI